MSALMLFACGGIKKEPGGSFIRLLHTVDAHGLPAINLLRCLLPQTGLLFFRWCIGL